MEIIIKILNNFENYPKQTNKQTNKKIAMTYDEEGECYTKTVFTGVVKNLMAV